MDSSAVFAPHNSSNICSLSKVTFRAKKAKRMSFSKITKDNSGEEFCYLSPANHTPPNKIIHKINLEENFQKHCRKKLNFSSLNSSKKEKKRKKVINCLLHNTKTGLSENHVNVENLEIPIEESNMMITMKKLSPSNKKQGNTKEYLPQKDSIHHIESPYSVAHDNPTNKAYEILESRKGNEKKKKHVRKQNLTNKKEECLDEDESKLDEENEFISHSVSDTLHSLKCNDKSKLSKMNNESDIEFQSSTEKSINVVGKCMSYGESEFSEQTPEQTLKKDRFNSYNSHSINSRKLELLNMKIEKKTNERSDSNKIESRTLKKYLAGIKKENNSKIDPINVKTEKLLELKVMRKKTPQEIDLMRKLLLSNAREEISSSSLSQSDIVTNKTNRRNSIDQKEKRILKKYLNNVKKNKLLKINPINNRSEDVFETKSKVNKKENPNKINVENEMELMRKQLLSNAFKTLSSPTQSSEAVTNK